MTEVPTALLWFVGGLPWVLMALETRPKRGVWFTFCVGIGAFFWLTALIRGVMLPSLGVQA